MFCKHCNSLMVKAQRFTKDKKCTVYKCKNCYAETKPLFCLSFNNSIK